MSLTDIVATWFWTLVAAAFGGFFMGCAWGQDIHHHEGQTSDVDRFYSTWMMPDSGRVQSCCHKIDCYDTEVKQERGNLYVRIRETGSWAVVPPSKIEQNYPDSRDSPDGRNHVCASPAGVVYCFTYGVGA